MALAKGLKHYFPLFQFLLCVLCGLRSSPASRAVKTPGTVARVVFAASIWRDGTTVTSSARWRNKSPRLTNPAVVPEIRHHTRKMRSLYRELEETVLMSDYVMLETNA